MNKGAHDKMAKEGRTSINAEVAEGLTSIHYMLLLKIYGVYGFFLKKREKDQAWVLE